MKSLKFADLRGTNTAIHCPTKEYAAQQLYIIKQQAMFRMRGVNPDRLKNVIFEMAKRVRG